MKIVAIICRILLGLMFIVFGANILHPFMPMQPPPAGSPPAAFMGVMGPSGWMHHVGFFQLLGGLLVLIGGTAHSASVSSGRSSSISSSFTSCLPADRASRQAWSQPCLRSFSFTPTARTSPASSPTAPNQPSRLASL